MTSIPHKANSSIPQTWTLGMLAEKTKSVVQGDPGTIINGIGTLEQAKAGQITFLTSVKYRSFLKKTNAAAVILTKSDAVDCPVPALICAEPRLVFAQIAHLIFPVKTVMPSIHPSVSYGDGCEIHPRSFIGPHCVIGERVKIGENVILQAGCFIGDDCEIESGTVFYPHVTVYHGCKIGKDCVLHSGVVIGSDGFGFAKSNDRWLKVPQMGGVRIGDRVEIGANTTIDRGVIEDTEIGNDVILDNLIQIGHNVKIGEGTAIAACSGVAGSTVIGKHCMIAGRTGIVGHITLTDHVHLVGSSNVGQSITKPGAYASGLTVTDMKTWKRNLVRFHQLDNLAMRLIELERKLKAKEEA